MTLVSPSAAQLVLSALLVFASASAITQGTAPLRESSQGQWNEREGAQLRLTRRIIQTAFLRHIAVTAWTVWEVWSSDGNAAATLGLLLMSLVLLVLGASVCVTNLVLLEGTLLQRHSQILGALHPLCLLGILLPHTLPGCSAHPAVALAVGHALEWQLYPSARADDRLLQGLQLEAAAALFVTLTRTGLASSLMDAVWAIVLAAIGGVVVPYATVLVTESLWSDGRHLRPLSARIVCVIMLLGTAIQFGFHVDGSARWGRGSGYMGQDVLAHARGQRPLLHATLMLQMLTVILSVVTAGAQKPEAKSGVASENRKGALAAESPDSPAPTGLLDRLIREDPRFEVVTQTLQALDQGQVCSVTGIATMGVLQAGALWHMCGQVVLGDQGQGVALIMCDIIILTLGALVQVPCAALLSGVQPATQQADTEQLLGAAPDSGDDSQGILPIGSLVTSELPPPPGEAMTRQHMGLPSSVQQAAESDSEVSQHWHPADSDASLTPTRGAFLTQEAGPGLSPDSEVDEAAEAAAQGLTAMRALLEQPPTPQAAMRAGAQGPPPAATALSHAVARMFPAARYVAVHWLQADRVSTNNYVLLGEGALAPPRLHAPVLHGSLVYYVLLKQQVAYITDCATPSGAFSDVQYLHFVLQVKRVACLPIVLDGKTYGCVLLGFPLAGPWYPADKAVASNLGATFSANCSHLHSLLDPALWPSEPQPSHPSRTAADEGGTPGTVARRRTDHGGSGQGQDPQALSIYNTSDSTAEFETEELEQYTQRIDAQRSPPAASDDEGSDDYATPLHNTATVALNDVHVLEIIGSGGFGNVYKALWNRQLVAVKVMEHGAETLGLQEHQLGDGDDADECRNALLEGAMTASISHPNVVTTYDYLVKNVVKPGGSTRRILQETQIIMEYCDRGSLGHVLEEGFFHRDNPRGAASPVQVDMEGLLVTLLEVAHAVEYLHSLQITHRDLKPKNILLKSSNKDHRGFTAKVSDFGLSQVLSDKSKPHITSKYCGTITHMPPELIEDGRVYAAGDVYAFGVIMWECYTQLTPYKGLVHPQIMMGVVSSCLRPAFPSTCPHGYRILAERCWQQDPKARPTFAQVATGIRTLLNAL